VSPAEPLLTPGVPSRVPPYSRCPKRSPSLHQVSPVEPLLTPGVPIRAPPYIWCPQPSSSLHLVSPAEPLFTSGVPIGAPPYIRCPQRSPSLHQVSPAEPLLTSGVPSGAPPYISVPSRRTHGAEGWRQLHFPSFPMCSVERGRASDPCSQWASVYKRIVYLYTREKPIGCMDWLPLPSPLNTRGKLERDLAAAIFL
ncbi:hypothetical protein AB205_0026930, partial [Aquarana catesbeiana]